MDECHARVRIGLDTENAVGVLQVSSVRLNKNGGSGAENHEIIHRKALLSAQIAVGVPAGVLEKLTFGNATPFRLNALLNDSTKGL